MAVKCNCSLSNMLLFYFFFFSLSLDISIDWVEKDSYGVAANDSILLYIYQIEQQLCGN